MGSKDNGLQHLGVSSHSDLAALSSIDGTPAATVPSGYTPWGSPVAALQTSEQLAAYRHHSMRTYEFFSKTFN